MSTLLPRKTINYRQVTFTRVKGVAQKVETPSTFIGSVQPITGKDVELLPAGREDKGDVKVYSDTPLNVGTEGSDKSGDVVEWQGKKWEIVQGMDFQNLINYYKYRAEFRGLI